MKGLSWWAWIKLTWTGRDARREYHAIETRVADLYRELADLYREPDGEGSASARARLLRLIAVETEKQIPLLAAGWGSDRAVLDTAKEG